MTATKTDLLDLDAADPLMWLSTREAASAVGAKENTLRALIRRGEGPPHYKIGSLNKFRAGELRDWRDGQRHE